MPIAHILLPVGLTNTEATAARDWSVSKKLIKKTKRRNGLVSFVALLMIIIMIVDDETNERRLDRIGEIVKAID